MRATIVIPSYWGRPSSELVDPGDAVYDHPTRLDAAGTLERALQSITLLDDRDYNVVVLACATTPAIATDVEQKVRGIAAGFRGFYPVTVLSHVFEQRLKERVAEAAPGELAEQGPAMVSLTGYSNIRNMCVIAAELARSEAAVLFDDDQMYEDPDYLKKVFENLGTERDGKFVGALAGYYLNREGIYKPEPTEAEWWMAEWPKTATMNAAFRIIENEPRLKPTPWVFGGNMVIHRDVYRKVSFDPNVRRGEDIDYLTNCKFYDIDFLLDNQLSIKHAPPAAHTPEWQKFREDVYRFVYAREKLRRQVPGECPRLVKVEELDPYPGRFMRDDLEEMIFKTCVLQGLNNLQTTDSTTTYDKVGFTEMMRNVYYARADAPPDFDPFHWYIEFRERWEKLMEFLASDERMSEELLGSM